LKIKQKGENGMKRAIAWLLVLFLTSCGVIDITIVSTQNGRIAADIHSGILVADIAEEDIDVQKEALVVLQYIQTFLRTFKPEGGVINVSKIMVLIRQEMNSESAKHYLKVDPRIVIIVLNTLERDFSSLEVKVESGALKDIIIITDLVVERLTLAPKGR
jgi:hypothetical protein